MGGVMVCIGFGTNEKLSSRLIRWATRSPWSHVWIEYQSAVWGGRWVAHSWADGVVKLPLERIEEAYPVSRTYECRSDVSAGFHWARSHISKGYDFGVIWNALLLVLFRVTRIMWLYKLVARNASRFSCSEFASGFLKEAGVHGLEEFDPELTTPGELEKFCADSDDFWVT